MPEDKKPSQSKSKGSKPDVGIPVTPVGPPVVIRPPILPPIFINPTITISSLSPVGTVVGGGDFILSVFGSNFPSDASVTWNQQPRNTTFVSSNQVTAQIAAGDISAVQAASVAVSGTILGKNSFSNSVTFNVIPDIGTIVSQLQAVAGNPAALLGELSTWVTLEQGQVDGLTTQVNNANTSVASLQSQVQNLNNTVTQQANTIAQLQAALAASKASTASPLDVAQSFKSVVDQIQQQARDAGGVQTTLTNMNVQLKTLISVQPQSGTAPPQAVLGFPDPAAPPDPNLLSTMTLAFGAIPNVKPASTPAPGPSVVLPRAPASATPSVPAPVAVSGSSPAVANPASAAQNVRATTVAAASSVAPSPVPQAARPKPDMSTRASVAKKSSEKKSGR